MNLTEHVIRLAAALFNSKIWFIGLPTADFVW